MSAATGSAGKPTAKGWWGWWRTPLTDAASANHALRELFGYTVRPGTELVAILPWFRFLWPGVLVILEPPYRSPRWACRWVRWTADPSEVWLVRSALGAVPPPRAGRARVDLDSLGPELDRLLGVSDDAATG